MCVFTLNSTEHTEFWVFAVFWFCRATAFGILNGICKFAAIMASFIFAAFIGITKIVPIFLAFAALVCGGLVALKLPETREKILSWRHKSETQTLTITNWRKLVFGGQTSLKSKQEGCWRKGSVVWLVFYLPTSTHRSFPHSSFVTPKIAVVCLRFV